MIERAQAETLSKTKYATAAWNEGTSLTIPSL